MKTRTVITVLLLVGCAGAQDKFTMSIPPNVKLNVCVVNGSVLTCSAGEPEDVPAIHVDTGLICRIAARGYPTDNMWCWTCADKRRVLLTSEDGKKHCILFPEAQP